MCKRKTERKERDDIFLLLQEKEDGTTLRMRNGVPRFTPFYPSHYVFLRIRNGECWKKQVEIVSRTGGRDESIDTKRRTFAGSDVLPDESREGEGKKYG